MKRLCNILSLLFMFGLSVASAQNVSYRTIEDIRYRNVSIDSYADSICTLNISYPVGKQGFSTVIWYHGGGLTGGEKEIPVELSGKGFAVVGVGYRLSPRATVKECIEDAASAAAWTVEHIEEYGGDKERIFVAGHSAGGYLTTMIGLDKQWLAPYGIDPDTVFAAMIPYSGQAITHYTHRAELGISQMQPVVDEYAPLYHVRGDCAPILIISGDRNLEMVGRYEENAYFWRMLSLAGHKSVELLELDGFDHGTMVAPAHLLTIRYIRNWERAHKDR